MTSLDPSRPYCVIPARFASSRFPGKPLVQLLDQPMILWVAKACAKAVGHTQVVIATDDDRIAEVAEGAGFHCERTSRLALTGTDRVSEVATRLGGTTVLNVQGDEPLVSPEDIKAVATFHQQHPELVVNGYTPVADTEDASRRTIPKVVLDQFDNLLYASRALIPASKIEPGGEQQHYLKQVCIYAFSPEQLKAFSDTGQKSPLESREDIEILRFVEMGQTVRMLKTSATSVAVDEPQDVETAERIMRGLGLTPLR